MNMGNSSRKPFTVAAAITGLVTTVLFTNSPLGMPPTDITAVWTGSTALLVLTIQGINKRLATLDRRLLLLSRDVNELQGRRRWRSKR